MEDVTGGFIKALVFSFIVMTVSCYCGYFTHLNRTSAGAQGVSNSDGSENPPAVASAPSPIPPVTPSPMARPIETTVQGTDSVDINPLAPSKTDVSTPGGIWDKIKKYLRELIIAAAGLVGNQSLVLFCRSARFAPAATLALTDEVPHPTLPY